MSTDDECEHLPRPDLKRRIWQPETVRGGVRMRKNPLSFQPSGAWHALEVLCRERDAARAEVKRLQDILTSRTEGTTS